MLKKYLLFFLLLLKIFALDIYVNTGKENDLPISVLHIKDIRDLTCKEEFLNRPLKVKEGVILSRENSYYVCRTTGSSHLLANQDLELFRLEFENKKDELKINIYPKTDSKLINNKFQLATNNLIREVEGDVSTSFSIIFYENLIKPEVVDGLNFQVAFKKHLPFVGALDLDHKPIFILSNSDVSIFLGIKNNFANERYDIVLAECNEAIEFYPRSIFRSEFELYKIRAMERLSKTRPELMYTLTENIKRFLRAFPSDEYYPELLSVLVRTYLELGQKSEAQYFIDILQNEHNKSKYNKIALLDYADFILKQGKTKDARIIYSDTLFNTDDADLASRCAISLAKINISAQNLEAAKEYVQKVLDANKTYLLQNIDNSLNIAGAFYKAGFFDISASLYALIYENINREEPRYEEVLKDLALSTFELKNYAKAEELLLEYHSKFKSGQFLTETQKAIDTLYFLLPDQSDEERHKRYQEIIEKYEGELAHKAIAEEIKLFMKERDFKAALKYQELVEKEQDLIQIKEMLSEASALLLNDLLDKDNCDEAINIWEQHSPSPALLKDKKSLLSCFMRKQKYSLAMDFSKTFKSDDEIFYSLSEAELFFSQKNYAKALASLQVAQKNPAPKSQEEQFKLLYLKALAQLHLDEYNLALNSLASLEKQPFNFKITEVYDEFLDYFSKKNLRGSSIFYGKKSIDIQNRLGINLYSPKHELLVLSYYVAGKGKGAKLGEIDLKEAQDGLAILRDLFKLDLSEADFTQAKYYQGILQQSLGQEELAQGAFLECISGDFKELCDKHLPKTSENPEQDTGPNTGQN